MKNILLSFCFLLIAMGQAIGQSVNITTSLSQCEGTDFNFNYVSSGLTFPVTCLWDFGDGSVSTMCNPSYIYVDDGTYTACLTLTDDNNINVQDCVDVTVSAPITPTPEIIVTDHTGNPVTDGLICGNFATLSVPSGFGIGSWCDGNTLLSINIYESGTYCAYTYSMNGCAYYTEVDIIMSSPPYNVVITDNPNNVLCPGESMTLSAGTGYSSYEWSTGETTQNIIVNSQGIYSVTVLDEACYLVAEQYVSSNNAPNVNISISETSGIINNDGTICEGDSITLSINNPSSNITYEWTGNNGNNLLSNTGTTVIAAPLFSGFNNIIDGFTIDYTVLATNNTTGCSSTETITITIHNTPNISIDPIPDFCENENAVLSATADAGGVYTWDINGNNSTGSVAPFTGVAEGGCVVTFTSDYGCTNTDEADLNSLPTPEIEITPVAPICEGEEATLMVTGTTGTYVWSGTNLLNTTGQTAATGGFQEGTYTYIVTITDLNGCTALDELDLIVYPVPAVSISITEDSGTDPNDGIICEGSTAILDAGNHDSYIWSNGETTSTIEVSTGGDYTVTVSNVNGCTSSAQVTITSNPNPSPLEIIVTDNATCGMANGVVLISTGSNPNSQTYIIEIPDNFYAEGLNSTGWGDAPAGEYTAFITNDATGCNNSSSFTILDLGSMPVPTGNTNAFFCPGESVTLVVNEPFSSYQWSNTMSTSSITVDIAGTYTVTVSDTNGCSATLEYNVSAADDCVWPGDANYDGIANNQDVLFLGMAYGNTGQTRDNANINWEGQVAEFEWDSIFNTGINQKHADSDGNGLVEQDDTLAIVQNYNLIPHELRGMAEDGFPLLVNFNEESEDYGERVKLKIDLGEVAQPISGAYGIAFSLVFNYPEVINPSTIQIDFSNSILGEEEELITLSKILLEEGRMDFAITRFDHLDMTDLYGELMSLSFIIEDNIDGFASTNYILEANPVDILCIHSWGEEIALTGESDDILMLGTSATHNLPTVDEGVNYYPNPTKDILHMNMQDNSMIQHIRVFDTLGKLVTEKKENDIQSIHTNHWTEGIYFLEITNNEGKQYLLKIIKE